MCKKIPTLELVFKLLVGPPGLEPGTKRLADLIFKTLSPLLGNQAAIVFERAPFQSSSDQFDSDL